MKHTIAVCNVHLGDTPVHIIFKGIPYIGFTLEIPVKVVNIDETADCMSLIITTDALETLTGEGHFLYLNNQLVGRIKNPDRNNIDTIDIPKETFKKLITPNNFMLLKIRIDDWDRDLNPGSGRLDDFVLKKIEIENAEVSKTFTIP